MHKEIATFLNRLGRVWSRTARVALAASFFVLSGALAQTQTLSNIRLEPHSYFGQRGTEPGQQLVIQGQLNWAHWDAPYPWQLLLHGDFETLGRKDNSVDVDRAWIQVPLGSKPGYSLHLGRIHPWDISHNFEATRPWGLLAQSSPQNRGILLGGPFSEQAFPNPTIQGWVGLHLWSDSSHSKDFQWGFSATPIFIPSMGSTVAYSSPRQMRVGRFGRRPPEYVILRDHAFPIQYEVDMTDILREVISPQLMAQAYYQVKTSSLHWESWVAVRRAPSINPELESKGLLDLRDSTSQVIAKVKPHFLQKWSMSLSQRFSAAALPKGYSLFSSMEWLEGGDFGAEIGVDSPFFGISYLNQFISDKGALYQAVSYNDHLLQLEARIAVARFTAYGGAKYHILNEGSWIRAGIRSNITTSLGLDLGVDIFTGLNGSYFGEWRSNDRIFLGILWKVGA